MRHFGAFPAAHLVPAAIPASSAPTRSLFAGRAENLNRHIFIKIPARRYHTFPAPVLETVNARVWVCANFTCLSAADYKRLLGFAQIPKPIDSTICFGFAFGQPDYLVDPE